MYGYQQHLVKDSPEVMAFLEYICLEANVLDNYVIYYCRQMLFKPRRFLTRGELDKELKGRFTPQECAQLALNKYCIA